MIGKDFTYLVFGLIRLYAFCQAVYDKIVRRNYAQGLSLLCGV